MGKLKGRFRYGREVFYGDILDDGLTVAGPGGRTHAISDLTVLPPVQPGKLVCVGLNYLDHAREIGMAPPQNPLLFLKPPSSVIGHLESIVYPGGTKHVDYEAELAVIIGKRCRHVNASDARGAIMGYTCFNDVTARDLQREDVQWTRAKSFDTFAPVGPFLATPDFDIRDLAVRARVNGIVRQESSTVNLIFGVPRLIEFISGIMTLEVGDIIATGTPPGVGPLHVGDEVEIEIEGIGVLKNSVVSEA